MSKNYKYEFTSCSSSDTLSLGEFLGSHLVAGDIVCLDGDLGAGKTVFVRGIAHALGITEHITSPTFTIINEYVARIPFYHFDVYRVGTISDMFDIGIDEYISNNGIIALEWASLIIDILPDSCVFVNITRSDDLGPEHRTIIITSYRPLE